MNMNITIGIIGTHSFYNCSRCGLYDIAVYGAQ